MRYYIRLDKNARVEGPLTVEALIEGIRGGRIPFDTLASSDLGEVVADLQVWRSCDWFPLAKIAELREVVPPLPVPRAPLRRVSKLTEICCLLGGVAVLYSSSERGWFTSALVVLTLTAIAGELFRYVWQRAKRNQAASR